MHIICSAYQKLTNFKEMHFPVGQWKYIGPLQGRHMSVMVSQITGHLSVFVQQFVRANIKERWTFAALAPCGENPPVISGSTSQRVSNAENVSISWVLSFYDNSKGDGVQCSITTRNWSIWYGIKFIGSRHTLNFCRWRHHYDACIHKVVIWIICSIIRYISLRDILKLSYYNEQLPGHPLYATRDFWYPVGCRYNAAKYSMIKKAMHWPRCNKGQAMNSQ